MTATQKKNARKKWSVTYYYLLYVYSLSVQLSGAALW